MHPREKKPKLLLDEVIQKLIKEDIEFTELNFQEIAFNPAYNAQDQTCTYHITDDALEMLGTAVKQSSKNLVKLVISDHDQNYSIEWTKEGAEAFGEAIKDHPTLNTISILLRTRSLPEEAVTSFLTCLTGSAPIINFIMTSQYNNSIRQLNLLGSFFQKKRSLREIYLDGKTSLPEEKQETSLINFGNSLASLPHLQTLSLKRVALADTGIKEIAETLLPSVTSLRKIRISSCGIFDEITPVCSLALQNPKLRVLDLSGNALSLDAINTLIITLPSLTCLAVLNLANIDFTKTTFTFFVSTYIEYKLKILHLTLNKNNLLLADPLLQSTSMLISHNKYLKRLDLDFTTINDAQVQNLEKTLADPARCTLEELHILGFTPSQIRTYRVLTNSAYKNEHLHLINMSSIFIELQVACEVNKKNRALKLWDTFNLAVLFFCSGKYSTSPNPSFSSISLDLIKKIFSYIRPRTSNTPLNSYISSIELIASNLQKRADSVMSGQYVPSHLKNSGPEENREAIKSIWWSTESKHAPARTLFLPRQIKEPNLMTLPDMISTLSPYANTAQRVIHDDDAGPKEIFLIDVSRLSAGEQRFIKDVFTRFFTHYFRDMYPSSPTTVTQTDNHTLQIQGIMVNLQSILQASQDNLATQESKGCCRIM